jgi:lycopene elongase/hydratase (dihydrobisanhydrobacterioruberin-forming)
VSRLASAASRRDVLAVHRLEFPFPVNYVCYASWGACFAAGDVAALADPAVAAAVVANLLLITAGLVLNTAADVRTDERHREKRYLARAARRFGTGTLIGAAVAEAAAGLLLACLAAVWAGRPLVAVTAVVIIVTQVLYNVEPVRLKRRGLTGVAAFCVAEVVLPFPLSYWAVRPDVAAACWPIVAGLGILSIGRMTQWSVPDRAADVSTGIETPSVRYGQTGAMSRAVALMIAGLVLAGWGLWWRFGVLWAVPLVALLAVQLRRRPASSRHIRLATMTPAMIGMVALTLTPLVAP